MKAYAAAFLAAAIGTLSALGGPLDRSCLTGSRTGASLLFPYFEVDLVAGDGTTTLVSIGNAGEAPTLAHVVVWTDWGLPTTAFDLALDADQVQSLNLRALLGGQIPVTGAGLEGRLDAPSCTFPITPPTVDVAELQARHSGRPSPFSGLCYGSGRRGFGGTTDLLVWNAGIGAGAEPKTCGGRPFDDASDLPHLRFTPQNEAGAMLASVGFMPPALAFRVAIGGQEIPLDPGQFGTVEVDATVFDCPISAPCIAGPLQSWVASLIRASGRYSVGVEATRLVDPCQDPSFPP